MNNEQLSMKESGVRRSQRRGRVSRLEASGIQEPEVRSRKSEIEKLNSLFLSW
ncbi:hypothetical protein [Brasilonema sp. UFV-L1]|uniref:hypothetical protein n=1 Tax=Brasilonema sp. UFV-L1 TaxID=2234130 RepID=UPI0030D7A2C4